MRALVLDANGVRFDGDFEPQLRADHVPIRVLQAGVCETDLQLMQGYMGFRGVLGHEFVGVATAGPFTNQRVVGEINCSCHDCPICRRGLANHCPHRTVLGILNHDGAFADTVSLPQRNLHVVPDSVIDDEAVFVEPLAAAFQIPAQLDLNQFARVVVLGDGRLGNLCAQVLKLSVADLLVVGKHAEKLALLSDVGIPTCLLDDAPADHAADLVVDCTGSASGLPTAFGLVRPRGTIVLKTTVAAETGPNTAPVVIDELTIVGSRCGPFPRAIEALERREVDVKPLIAGRFPLEDGVAALEAARTGLKTLITVNS